LFHARIPPVFDAGSADRASTRPASCEDDASGRRPGDGLRTPIRTASDRRAGITGIGGIIGRVEQNDGEAWESGRPPREPFRFPPRRGEG
jgi:hypothetical protein